MSAIFCLSKTRQNKHVTVASSFNPSKSHQKCQKRYNDITSIFQLQKLYRRKYVETTSIFRLSKLRGKKYVETASIFYPSKLYRRKYAEMTSIFRLSKLCERQYVGVMQIFHPSKLRSRKYVEMTSISLRFFLKLQLHVMKKFQSHCFCICISSKRASQIFEIIF